jgi:hypothetical protein
MPEWSDKAETIERRFRTEPEETADQENKSMQAANKPQMMLALHFAHGRERLFSYADLMGVDVNGDTLRLYFIHATVTVVIGTGMIRVVDGLRRHIVFRLRESTAAPFDTGQEEVFIRSMEIGPPEVEALHAPVR